MAWTDKMVEDLKVMWKQGLTTGEIGRRLNVSKNSVIGKVHRLQLDARPSPIKRKEQTGDLFESVKEKKTPSEVKKTPAPKVEPKKPAKPEFKTPKPELKTPKPEPKVVKETPVAPLKAEKKLEEDIDVSSKFFLKQPCVSKDFNGNAKLTDLDNHTCRWPLGDPKDENFRFCGRKVRMGQTYCEEHSALAYVKPTKK